MTILRYEWETVILFSTVANNKLAMRGAEASAAMQLVISPGII